MEFLVAPTMSRLIKRLGDVFRITPWKWEPEEPISMQIDRDTELSRQPGTAHLITHLQFYWISKRFYCTAREIKTRVKTSAETCVLKGVRGKVRQRLINTRKYLRVNWIYISNKFVICSLHVLETCTLAKFRIQAMWKVPPSWIQIWYGWHVPLGLK